MKVYQILNAAAKNAIEVNPSLGAWVELFQSELQLEVERVSEALNAAALTSALKSVSSRFEGASKNQIDAFFPTDLPEACNRLDLLFRPSEVPGWRIGVEVCTDNRQAIAMNLFKLELMNRTWQTASETGHQGLGFAITIAKEVRSSRWDGAVGTSQEYEYALQRTYSQFLTTPIGLMVIDI